MSKQIGPALPPGFLTSQSQSSSDSDDDGTTNMIGPVIPKSSKSTNQSDSDKRVAIGPVMPPGFNTSKSHSESDNEASIGPCLPPGFGQQKDASENPSDLIGPSSSNQQPEFTRKYAGPDLPPDYRAPIKGPQLPPVDQSEHDNEDDDDDDVIGPLPSDICGPKPSVAEEFERRANKMKDKIEGKNEVKKVVEREEWMTELPSIELSAALGMGARQFRTSKLPTISDADREGWSSKPGDKPKSAAKRPAPEYYRDEIDEDRRKADAVQNYNKSERSESLMDMHSKKLKKEKKESSNEKPERVPFDRERDLNTKKFDDAQRKAILKKAAKLDSRFSHGSKQYM